MKKLYVAAIIIAALVVAGGSLGAAWYWRAERAEQLRFERGETELIVTNLAGAPVRLFKAGKSLSEAAEIKEFSGARLWLPRGNYFLQADLPAHSAFYPVMLTGYRRGPDEGGAFVVTVRSLAGTPPSVSSDAPAWAYVPGGSFLLGDRLNPREPHYVWLPAFFISPFEVSNAEFREFARDAQGYASDAHWSEAGRRWKAANQSQATALLNPADAEFQRFGQDDQPVTGVTWFEAQAFCRRLTQKYGQGRWLFALPSEAEWEKAARGPDGLDYALGQTLSDHEVGSYNWKKNPGAPITVVGRQETQGRYQPNRYGLYHLSGNVVEWTQSVSRPYNREHPYDDNARNRDDASGERVARGGSWYSASIALLYIPYRDTFLPEVRHHDLGFRVVARPLP